MAPPSEDSQNRRPSRRPPPRFSPGPTQKSGGGVHPRNKSVPPPSSQDDVVGRVKEAFSRTVPKLLQLPEADFNLPDSILKLKMSSKTRSKSKPPTEEPKEKKTLRSRKSEPSPKGRKSTFSTPKLPGESSRGNDSVIYSPAAKRPRIMPKKYRDEPEPPPKPRRKKVPIPEDQEIVYGDNPFGTRTIWGDRGPSQGNSTKNAAVKNTISPEDDPEWSESSGSDDEHPEPKVLNTTKHRNSGGKSMFSVATPEKVAPVDEAAGSRKGLRAKSVFENDRNAPSTSKKSDSELFKTPELPGRRSGVGIVSPAGLVKRVPRGSTANGVSPSQRTPEDPNLKPAFRNHKNQKKGTSSNPDQKKPRNLPEPSDLLEETLELNLFSRVLEKANNPNHKNLRLVADDPGFPVKRFQLKNLIQNPRQEDLELSRCSPPSRRMIPLLKLWKKDQQRLGDRGDLQ
ncbi:hypothetical protein QR680_006941 [Steinernema hermaphroditum]|uniref:Uncharacterized protein n=1 Tax=Steinernema hermaphroditum TaxID=289476 RepID=A0AA39HYI0_9BILA|nr:hypothetical protein QR680_006941 [Steinernema hermaphroditum]